MTRPATSDALIALRQAMNMNQGKFAVLVLDCAITTIARYETTHPPHGDLLLRLAEIAEQEAMKERSPAEQEKFIYLMGRFKELYHQEAREKLGDLFMVPRTDAEEEHTCVTTSAIGELAMRLADCFIPVKSALAAKDEKAIPKKVMDALAAMEEAAEVIGGRIRVETARRFPALMANPAKKNSPTPKTSRTRSKKR